MGNSGVHSFVELFERARHPEALALFTESQLAWLLDRPGLPASLIHAGLGELLLRRWLYLGEWPETLARAFLRYASERLKAVAETFQQHETPEGREFIGPTESAAWAFFRRRAQLFLEAHGLIALLAGRHGEEAVIVPFRFLPNLPREARVRDMAGNTHAAWSSIVAAMEAESGEDLGFAIGAVMPAGNHSFEGPSFGLPLLIARARASGALASFPVLRVLATGEIRGSSVQPVQGVSVKAALASRMGAFFISPGLAGANRLSVEPGTTIRKLIPAVEAAFLTHGLSTPSPRQAYDAVRTAEEEVHLGVLKLGDAERRLARCTTALQSEPASPFAKEGLLRISILRAAIANHQGDPARARLELEEAGRSPEVARNPRLYVGAVAFDIVALADLGFLAEAERAGRDLLSWVDGQMVGDLRDRLWCEMVACGALGGQALLARALREPVYTTEARRLLQRASQLARELDAGAELCRAATQLSLCQALLEPESGEASFAASAGILARHSWEERRVSRAYLLRTRFLAGYRHLLLHGVVSGEAEDWELPDHSIGHASWPYAVALKYRGALRAAGGALTAAGEDFHAALDLLLGAEPPLLRFIGGTVALQAAESLYASDRETAVAFLDQALAVFRGFESPPGPALDGQAWIRRSEALGVPDQWPGAPHPQLQFPY